MNGFLTMQHEDIGILRDLTPRGCTSRDCPLRTGHRFRSHIGDIPDGQETSTQNRQSPNGLPTKPVGPAHGRTPSRHSDAP